MSRTVPRKRLPAEQAKQRILDVALEHFRAGGADGVRVQPIAAELGVTDASIHYHFGNRQGLLEALLKRAGRELDRTVRQISEGQPPEGQALEALAAALHRVLDEQGYADLAYSLWRAGWRSRGAGMLEPLAEALSRRGEGRPGTNAEHRREARHVVALLHTVMIAEALFGGEVLRSVGLRDTGANRREFRAWVLSLLENAAVAD